LASLFLLCNGQHVEIRCHFRYIDIWDVYECITHEYIITQNNTSSFTIVGDHFPNMTNLDVNEVSARNQPIPFVITEFFTTFPNLRRLNTGGLQRIQDDAFTFAHNFLDLWIANSPLRVVPANGFVGASNLQFLQISDCHELEKIDQNAFSGLNNLRRLTITNTKLRFLSENVFSTLPYLRAVTISNNQISTLPENIFHNNLRLEEIMFANNSINAVGRNFVDNLANMTNLWAFAFIGNNCGNGTYFPPDFTDLHTALQECYRNYEQRRHFQLDLQGSLVIRDENGDVVFDAHV